MAILGDHNNTLAFTFGVLGNVISFMVFLAPLPTIYQIYKKKSTEGFQSPPYLLALFSSMLWLYYAWVKTGAVLIITINSFGCVIKTIYIIIYITYAPRDARNLTLKLFGAMNLGSFGLILLVTQFTLHSSARVQVLGWICVSISAQVIRTKSVEFMPFNLPLLFLKLSVSGILWFAYGLFLKDICIALPNVVGFALGVVEMVLYAIYRNKNKEEEKKKNQQVAMEAMKSVVAVLSGGSEVFPDQVEEEGVVSGDDVKQQNDDA